MKLWLFYIILGVSICLNLLPIGSMYAIYDNIYHQYTPNFSIYTIHGSYGYGGELEKHLRALKHQGALKEAHGESYLRTAGLLPGFLFRNQSGKIWKRS